MATAFLLAAVLTAPAAAQASPPGTRIAVTIDPGKTHAPVCPFLYGKFIEHIGDWVNRSVWA